jgi:glycerol-3-phosphate O-acyltransferase
LTTEFQEEIKAAMRLGKGVSTTVTKDNVYQEGNAQMTPILDRMTGSLMLPGSGVDGMENLEELLAKAQSGRSCLLLLEHYSNMDLSIFSLLARRAGGRGREIADAVIAIAGAKLNEDNPVVAAFASAYTRIVIYPSSYLKGLPPEKKQEEVARGLSINRAAMKALEERKTSGRLVLVFPAGTRYRPWDPSTKKGVREIDSYIKAFDFMCCVALNGDILHVQEADMMDDMVSEDVVRVTAGPVLSCAEFRAAAREKAAACAQPGGAAPDLKQAAVDAVMAELDALHAAAEEKRGRA